MGNIETNDTTISVFKHLSRNLLLYGFESFSYHVDFLVSEVDNHYADKSSVNYFLFNLNKALQKHGDLFMYYYVKKPSFKKKNYSNKPINEEHVKLCKKIVCDVFDVKEDEFLEKDKRDGKRIFASAAFTSLLIDVLSYSRKDILKILNKSNVFISQRKKIIDDLDHSHRFEKGILDKYLNCKVELINKILNGNKEKN